MTTQYEMYTAPLSAANVLIPADMRRVEIATPRPPTRGAVCAECAAPIKSEPGRVGTPRGAFCTPEHRRVWNNRNTARAAPLMLLMQVWRKGRHKKGSKAAKVAFTELCLAIDKATAEDVAAGRPPAIEVYEARLRRQGLGGLI